MIALRPHWHTRLKSRTGLAIVFCVLAATASADPRADGAEEAELAAPPELAEESGAPPLTGALADAVSTSEADILGSGLPEGPAADGYRSDLERGWFSGGSRIERRAGVARVHALRLGADSVAGPAHALLAPAEPAADVKSAQLAVKLSPNLPLAHAALASAQWSGGERVKALESFAHAIAAIPHNLEATLWFTSSALLMSIAVVVFASLVFMAMAGLSVFPRAAHDLGDLFSKDMPGFARTALLGALIAVPLALGEGVLGLALVLFALGVAYGSSDHRVALGLAAAMLLIALFPLAEFGGRSLSMLSADPVAKSVHAIVKGVEGEGDLALLRSAEARDPLAAHGLAIQSRRTGHLDDAYHRYRALVELQPHNAVAIVSLANLEFQRGSLDDAIGLYERATTDVDSPVLWFNLSQAYARSFRMEEFENALRRAQTLDPDVADDLSAQNDPNLVADLPLPLSTLRTRMFEASDGAAFASWLRAPLAPGHVARGWKSASLSFGLVFLFGAIFAGRFDQAGTCGRCGVRICARCDGTVWNSLTCENCHRLFNHPETTDARLRPVRLAELRSREARIERVVRMASLIVPGVGGIFARRPDLALLALMLFSWSIVAFVWRAGVIPDPLVVGTAGSAVFLATALVSALTYAGLVVTGLTIRRNL